MLSTLVALCGITILPRPVLARRETALARAVRADPALEGTLVQLGGACASFETTISARYLTELENSFGLAANRGISIKQWIDTRSCQDFEHGNVVSVDGWILSRFEVAVFLYARRFGA